MEYGYIRVSTREQNEQRQLIAMQEFGISENRIYMDKQSGKNFERKNYKTMVRKLKKDDTLQMLHRDVPEKVAIDQSASDYFFQLGGDLSEW